MPRETRSVLRGGAEIPVERRGETIQVSVGAPPPGKISIEMRSLYSLLQIGAASIEMPPALEAVARCPPSRPERTRVAIEYRGRWFHIDDADLSRKQWFPMFQLLASATVPDTTHIGPLLTIPAGRKLPVTGAVEVMT